MPLHDHFRGDLARRHPWTSFQASWATYLSEDLNELLPPGYFAGPYARFEIEIDVAAWERTDAPSAEAAWSPAPPQAVAPFVATTDEVEVRIYRNAAGDVLAGAVELISPANKDRPETREAFVAKCARYLDQGAGVAIIDAVTERQADLHRLLLGRVAPAAPPGVASALYAAAYRPVMGDAEASLAIWHEPLALGAPLPTLPLWLRGAVCVPLRLEETYQTTLRKQRISTNGA